LRQAAQGGRLPGVEGHTLDEDGEHYEEECYQCLLSQEVKGDCRCAECCKRLLIEVELEDAEREPRIKELGSPINGFDGELEGYLLNGKEDMACVFLDQATNLCRIYETRPLLCRLFDCQGEGREQLIELGIIDR
jgi:Fe-S-cluster containining protein